MGCSVDSEYVHLAWTNTPRNQGGIGKLKFPLPADVQHKICQVRCLPPPLTHALTLRARSGLWSGEGC